MGTGTTPQGAEAEASTTPQGAPAGPRPHWVPVSGIVIVIATIQLFLPPSVTLGPLWLIPVIELLGIPITIGLWAWTRGGRARQHHHRLNRLMTVYLAWLVAASGLNAVLLLRTLLFGSEDSAVYLLLAGFAVLAINTLTFGLIYWWLDGGGPTARAEGTVSRWDFQFPQQAAEQDWDPTLIDYLFTAYTNIIAFSPTDTMPLTHRVKLLFTVQSSISLTTVLVTVSRAINMLPSG